MDVTHVLPFLSSVFDALSSKAAAHPERGPLQLRTGPTLSTRELTATVTFRGDLAGDFFCSVSLATAAKLQYAMAVADPDLGALTAPALVAHMTRQACDQAVAELARSGLTCQADEPVVSETFGAAITSLSPVLMVPVLTEHGDMDLGLAFVESSDTAGFAAMVATGEGEGDGQ